MKRGTPHHPKMHELCSRLGVPLYSACGILELLWHFTAKYAPAGNVGKFTDEAIARAVGWTGDATLDVHQIASNVHQATTLINALVESRWLDKDDTHRLLVHDWQDHADQTVRRVLAKHGNEMLASCQQTASMMQNASLPKARAIAIAVPPIVPQGGQQELLESSNQPNGYTAEFEQFWAVYPRKVGKGFAFKAWMKAKGRPPVSELVSVIEQNRKTDQWNREGGQFIPHPATWLNQRRWEDTLSIEIGAPKTLRQKLVEQDAKEADALIRRINAEQNL